MTNSADKHYWWIKLDFARHLADMAMLDYEQQGIYQHMMLLTAAGTPIPSDMAKLARVLRISTKKLDELMAFVGGQFELGDETLVHIEIRDQKNAAIKRSEDGRMFAQKRWSKTKSSSVVVHIDGGEK